MENDSYYDDLTVIVHWLNVLKAAWQKRPNGNLYFKIVDYHSCFKRMEEDYLQIDLAKTTRRSLVYSRLLEIDLQALQKCFCTPMICTEAHRKTIKIAAQKILPICMALRAGLAEYLTKQSRKYLELDFDF